MDEFKSNSHKSKVDAQAKEQKEKRQLAGTVKIAETRPGFRGVVDEFVKEDAPTVAKSLWKRVLVPAVRQTTYDMVTNGARMFLWGSSGGGSERRPNDQPRERYSYSQYYDYKRDRDRDQEPVGYKGRPRYDAMVFTNEQDAVALLNDLKDILERYKRVSVLKMFDLLEMDCDHTLENWGWRDLTSADIVPVEDGFWLKLPKAKQIT